MADDKKQLLKFVIDNPDLAKRLIKDLDYLQKIFIEISNKQQSITASSIELQQELSYDIVRLELNILLNLLVQYKNQLVPINPTVCTAL